MSEALTQLKDLCGSIWNLYSIRSLLYWDQQVMMPTQSGPARANQLATLERVSHELLTAPSFLSALQRAEDAATLEVDRHYVRATRRAYDLAAKLPSKLVEEKARVQAMAVEAWTEAKKREDFALFLPHLREVFRLTREVAEHRGYQAHPYDAMIDEYEPGMNTAQVESLFSGMLPGLIELVQGIARAQPVSRKILQQAFPTQNQQVFSRYLLEQIGFNFDRGRLDQSTHPFCASSSSLDIRLTDRLDERLLTMSIFGSLHEGGHGLYEQGCPVDWSGTPLGGGSSLGIHESQSRLYENFVGRSLPFWKAHFPRLRSLFPDQLWGYEVEDFYRAINFVEPSFIRVEADEVTYTLHIVMRFELERDLLAGTLDPGDLPGAWIEKMEKTMGIRPPSDRWGCLQDIHWSDGLIGYFPTYSLGNLVAAQLWSRLRQELPDLDQQLAQGNCCSLLGWLRQKVHRHASALTPQEVIRGACGQDLHHQPFLDYLWEKFGPLYGVKRP
jgi:carboxypeptidase Taq